MPVTEDRTLDAAALVEVMVQFHGLVQRHRNQLNRLNVYPVPDADTGNNLEATIQSVVDALGSASSMPEVCAAIRRGALLGAHGVSGVIMAQFLGVFATQFLETDQVSGADLAGSLTAASRAADAAVARPVEGTILTVARDAAAAAGEAGPDATVAGVAMAARDAGEASLATTPDLLPALRDAGVVDSGGSGFVLFLHALAGVVAGTPPPDLPSLPLPVETAPTPSPRYEVVLRLEGARGTVAELRRAFEQLGNDSTVVVADGDLWLAHVHTDDLESALGAARAAGTVRDLQVTDLLAQMNE